ncbi:hypothetical protein CCACVL1_01924 [Corchorus capsularis]|uniref:Protein BIG GRAIN 1-like E n=1 Tax=Corchorus capsularis TaxID=210143 RepID=A0A1R3KE75_COCAP|nr:hypothetical protein CCACVL1_01924 [Corchorus capsularis]
MSVAGVNSDPDRMFKKSFHRRNDSGELDVFEAARYFSGYNNNEAASYNCATFTQKIMREDRQPWRGGRISLDVPAMRSSNNNNPLLHHHHQNHQQIVEKQIKEKKYKQPSSPGGRLASFLNSLFNQTSSKKKKSKSTTQSMKDHEEESPGGRRKRRSSISHFRSSSTADTKSFYSSSSSGFRTPPAAAYAQTPTKNYKDFRSYSDHKQVLSLSSKQSTRGTGTGQTKSTALQNNNNTTSDYSWLDEKLKFIDGYSDKQQHKNKDQKEKINWAEKYPSEEKEFRKFSEIDEGADSDSSSDLFELQNYDLGIYSSGLPVYETTHMDNIKRGAPISNAVL